MSVTRKRWGLVRIEEGLAKEIDRYLERAPNLYGARRYDSRADFVKEACIRLLEHEGVKVEVAART